LFAGHCQGGKAASSTIRKDWGGRQASWPQAWSGLERASFCIDGYICSHHYSRPEGTTTVQGGSDSGGEMKSQEEQPTRPSLQDTTTEPLICNPVTFFCVPEIKREAKSS
jgi:hypothetical protein